MEISDDFFSVDVPLTNFQIKSYHLCSQDADKFVELRNRPLHISRETAENRKRVLSCYQVCRLRHMNQQFLRNQLGLSGNHGTAD